MNTAPGPRRARWIRPGPEFATSSTFWAVTLLLVVTPAHGQTAGSDASDGEAIASAPVLVSIVESDPWLSSARGAAAGTVRWCLGLDARSGGAVALGSGRRVRTRRDGSPCRDVAAEAPQAVGLNEVSPGKAFLYSALVPGMGQRLLGQGRWVPYLAVEVWSWLQFYLRRTRGEDLQQEYRDLAWDVARRVSVGSRVDGDFPYYESLTQFRASGAFDQDPLSAGIQPETDPDTFNGELWELAGEIFFPPDSDAPPAVGSPEYDRALQYYVERSVTPRFAWNWGDSELQQAAFNQLIKESDEELRSSTTMIGVILANHFVSAVDALISARLRKLGGNGNEIDVSTFPPGPHHRLGIQVRVRP